MLLVVMMASTSLVNQAHPRLNAQHKLLLLKLKLLKLLLINSLPMLKLPLPRLLLMLLPLLPKLRHRELLPSLLKLRLKDSLLKKLPDFRLFVRLKPRLHVLQKLLK